MNEELIEFANLVAEMRDAQKKYNLLKHSQRVDERGEAGELMSDLQRKVDSELIGILGLED